MTFFTLLWFVSPHVWHLFGNVQPSKKNVLNWTTLNKCNACNDTNYSLHEQCWKVAHDFVPTKTRSLPCSSHLRCRAVQLGSWWEPLNFCHSYFSQLPLPASPTFVSGCNYGNLWVIAESFVISWHSMSKNDFFLFFRYHQRQRTSNAKKFTFCEIWSLWRVLVTDHDRGAGMVSGIYEYLFCTCLFYTCVSDQYIISNCLIFIQSNALSWHYGEGDIEWWFRWQKVRTIVLCILIQRVFHCACQSFELACVLIYRQLLYEITRNGILDIRERIDKWIALDFHFALWKLLVCWYHEWRFWSVKWILHA